MSGDAPLTLLEGFDAMRAFLDARFEDGDRQSGEVAILLGSMARNITGDGGPADPAQWGDWLDAIASARPNPAATANAQRLIGVRDAFFAMRAFLAAYFERSDGQERDIGAVLESLCGPDGAPAAEQWDRWLAAVRIAKAG